MTDPAGFTPAHARALRRHLGAGASRVLPGGASVPETGIVGSGTSVTCPAVPDPVALARYGHVSRALYQVGEAHAALLSIVYGAPGELATAGGLYPSRLWRAAAPFTQAAAEGTAAWLERDRRKGRPPLPPPPEGPRQVDDRTHTPREEAWRADAGPAVIRWLSLLFDPDPHTHPSPACRARLPAVEAQAKAQLAAAEAAFAAVCTPMPSFYATDGDP